MRYSIEPKDRMYLKGYGFSSFAKNIRADAAARQADERCNI